MPHMGDEREARKRYVRERQNKVFTIVVAAMVVLFVISLLVFFHVLGGEPKDNAEDGGPVNFGSPSVCAPAEKNADHKTKDRAVYMANSEVSVRVLNGTSSTGFAKAVGEALENRHFSVVSISNFEDTNVKRTTIYYGVNAIADAYTLNANFSDAKMVMDDRTDDLVDVVIGATFNDLVETKSVPAAGASITNLEGCTPLDKVDKSKLPKALVHDPIVSSPRDDNPSDNS